MKHPKNVQIRLSDQQSIDLVLVEGGRFLMGDKDSEYDDERPVHEVTVSGFYMGKYQVTQAQWQAIMGNNPSQFKAKNRPVETVNWDDVQEFIKRLNGKTEKNFRLPSEAEWEYAARGGNYCEGYLYAGSDKLKQVGWYGENSNNETHEVGQLLANEVGLFDMSGNVYEWCEDDWHYNYDGAPYGNTVWMDSPIRDSRRIRRGGSYARNPQYCRSTYRFGSGPGYRDDGIGFRLVLPL